MEPRLYRRLKTGIATDLRELTRRREPSRAVCRLRLICLRVALNSNSQKYDDDLSLVTRYYRHSCCLPDRCPCLATLPVSQRLILYLVICFTGESAINSCTPSASFVLLCSFSIFTARRICSAHTLWPCFRPSVRHKPVLCRNG